MDNLARILQADLATGDQHGELACLAARRNWGWALLLTGWLHLAAFSLCYYLTIARDFHESAGYMAIWIGELLGAWAIFRVVGGRRRTDEPVLPLERFVRRVWIAYFLLAFNLGSMNMLRGHALFEFFPAVASLASFAFIMMSVVVSWRFLGAVLVLFAAGLLSAAHLLHAYLIFALAWWLVLNVIGLTLIGGARRNMRAGIATRSPIRLVRRHAEPQPAEPADCTRSR
ncbi:MAG: hypothetical protein FJ271_15200 [Planctomycetes bacterium]|nr:hypothetical protein [Planctomycetota bacterium]